MASGRREHFPFFVCHCSFVIWLAPGHNETNDKWEMENDKRKMLCGAELLADFERQFVVHQLIGIFEEFF